MGTGGLGRSSKYDAAVVEQLAYRKLKMKRRMPLAKHAGE